MQQYHNISTRFNQLIHSCAVQLTGIVMPREAGNSDKEFMGKWYPNLRPGYFINERC